MSTMSLSSSMAKLFSLLKKLFCAKASTRMPCAFISFTMRWALSRIHSVNGCTSPSYSAYAHTMSISSTAPLVIICRLPFMSSTTTDIRLRVKSNGISSTFLYERLRASSPSSLTCERMARSIRFFSPV